MSKNFRTFIFFIYTTLPFISLCTDVIYILGPSCSGKSTTAVTLVEELGPSWKLIEYDVFERHVRRKNAYREETFSRTLQEAHKQLNEGYQVIIDSNAFFPELCTLTHSKYDVLKIYMYAPLKTLLQRYEERRKKYHHRKSFAKWVRKFIIGTFYRFYPTGIPKQSERVLDSTKLSLPEVIAIIKKLLSEAQRKKESADVR
jgi:cytidylate kinase